MAEKVFQKARGATGEQWVVPVTAGTALGISATLVGMKLGGLIQISGMSLLIVVLATICLPIIQLRRKAHTWITALTAAAPFLTWSVWVFQARGHL